MANTLASLFNSRKQEIYSKFSNRDILIEIKPDTNASRSRIKDDSRALPVVSVQRDASRISKFLKSNQGLLFVGKQLLLQTGNTFAETRLYNPLGVLINVPPAPLGRYFPRHIGKPSTSIKTPTRKYRGALQQETIDAVSNATGNIFSRIGRQVVNTLLSPVNSLLIKPKLDPSGQYYLRPEDNNNWFPRLILNQPLGERGTKYITKTYANQEQYFKQNIINPAGNRSQLKIYNSTLVTNPQLYNYSSSYLGYIEGKNKLIIGTPGSKGSKFVNPFYEFIKFINPTTAQNVAEGLKIASVYTTHTVDNTDFYKEYQSYKGQTLKKAVRPTDKKPAFSYLESTNSTNGYFYGPKFKLTPQQDGTPVNYSQADIALINAEGLTDSYNTTVPFINQLQVPELQKGNVDYSAIESPTQEKSDIIKFIFKDTTTDTVPLHFRAFISTIKQNVKPEFNEQRYVGRTERFVTYSGAKRSVTMTFNIVAFSPAELDAMWLRINYLTGLAFPKSTSPSGFMVPPLFKITIGGLYDDQPCYIENMDFDFLDETITFDIDKEVSQTIKVTISLILLEKRSRFYNSPFYGVSEKISEQRLSLYNSTQQQPPTIEVPDSIAAFNQQQEQNWSSFVKNQLNNNDFSTKPWSADQFNQWYRTDQEYLARGQERADTVNRASQTLSRQRQDELNKIYEENARGLFSGEIPLLDDFCQNAVNYESCVDYYNETYKINRIEYLKAALEAGTEQVRAEDFIPSMREADRQASIYSRQLQNTRL